MVAGDVVVAARERAGVVVLWFRDANIFVNGVSTSSSIDNYS